jgi:hypothetical protein
MTQRIREIFSAVEWRLVGVASRRCSRIKSQVDTRVANKCERVKAKGCNLTAEAHSSGHSSWRRSGSNIETIYIQIF